MSQEERKEPEAAENSGNGNENNNAESENVSTPSGEVDAPDVKEEEVPEENDDLETPAESTEKAEDESERFLRLAAEFDNYKKRTAREFGDVIKTANIRLLRSLVEIVDNFERALSHDTGDNDGDAYRKGVELIYNQLAELLKKESVTSIESVGQPFDPNFHEAMMQAESEEYDEGLVCQEIQKGYKIDEKVLRHARVIVSRGKPDSNDENK